MTREEAINEWTFRSEHIKKWLDEYGEEPSIRRYVELIDMAIDALKQTAWIPVGERLPSGQENVIVTIYDDHGDTPWEYTTNAWHIDGVWIADNDIVCGSVVAWMPLPEPYKGGEDK